MLRDEVARYTELSGNDGLHTPIGIIGAYLDGYEKGRADAQPKLDENTLSEQQESDKLGVKTGETCTDCISRQAAIDAFTCNGSVFTYGDKVCKAIVSRIMHLPSAQPERKVGEWIVDEKRFGCTERHCSLCGAILEGDDWKWRNNNYCYHCGARMEETDERT